VPRIDEVVKKNVGVICVFFCVFAVVVGREGAFVPIGQRWISL
jgi:hypothetical protein